MFTVDDTLSIFSKPEIGLLSNIVQLGYYYQQIEFFMEIQSEGAYVQAFTMGV
jgi:hypothetical protein